jgi:hypothetical protein
MNFYNYPIITPFIITLSTFYFKSIKNPNLSEFNEITKNTSLPLITNLQHNEFQTLQSSYFKKIMWLLTFLFIHNHFPDSSEKNIILFVAIFQNFIFHGDFMPEYKIIFNLSIHLFFTMFLILLFIRFKLKYQTIHKIQYLTLLLNIYILIRDRSNYKFLSNTFVYLEWLNYVIEFFPYQLFNLI